MIPGTWHEERFGENTDAMAIGAGGGGSPSPGAETAQSVTRKHHPAENSRSSFELWLMPLWGKLKASKERQTENTGVVPRARGAGASWLDEGKAVRT